jgi:hypothetical protein
LYYRESEDKESRISMKDYTVSIYEKVAHIVDVQADSEDEAYDKAYEVISLGKPYDIEAVEFTGEWRAEEA